MRRSLNQILLPALIALTACAPPLETASAPAAPAKPSYVTITVRADGGVEIDGSFIAPSDMERRFTELAATGVTVVISPHKDAGYGKIARVMATAQRTGLTKWGVIGGT